MKVKQERQRRNAERKAEKAERKAEKKNRDEIQRRNAIKKCREKMQL